MKMAKWILPLLLLVGCGQPADDSGAPAPVGKTEPTTGTYTVHDIQYSPVYHAITDPITGEVTTRTTWWIGARARCSGCDMTGAFDVGIRVYVNGVPHQLFYTGSRFTLGLGDIAGDFSGFGSANIGSMASGTYSVTVEVYPRPGFQGQSISLTAPITIW